MIRGVSKQKNLRKSEIENRKKSKNIEIENRKYFSKSSKSKIENRKKNNLENRKSKNENRKKIFLIKNVKINFCYVRSQVDLSS